MGAGVVVVDPVGEAVRVRFLLLRVVGGGCMVVGGGGLVVGRWRSVVDWWCRLVVNWEGFMVVHGLWFVEVGWFGWWYVVVGRSRFVMDGW